MDLSELTAYAAEKYQIQERHKWNDFPGFSVLCHPQTGKWVALLMRQWDSESGEEIQRCDIKCGRDMLRHFSRAYLSMPVRMHGDQWIDIAFDRRTEPEVAFYLLDQAVALGNRAGCTVILESRQTSDPDVYRDTPLNFTGRPPARTEERVPEQLRQMRRLYDYGRVSAQSRAESFYRQAVFMQDYEDDFPWKGRFTHYFPTYQDLSISQLRGYFTWRARVRRGEFQPIAASAAYIYIYELLNGIGTASPGNALKKMEEFETGYLDSGLGDARMRVNLKQWMLEYAIVHDLPLERIRKAADPEVMERDCALSVLRQPEAFPDDEVFRALCFFGGKNTEKTPVLSADPERGKRLFSNAWRTASAYSQNGKGLFSLCFGEPVSRPWYPLSNAVYYDTSVPEDRDVVLNESRSYHCRSGVWQVTAYVKLFFDRTRLAGFLHETDAMLRRWLKTGRYLREKPENEWAIPYIETVIEEEKQALIEASKPKITIDLSSLDRIRRDALTTRDSLLIEEETEESEPAAERVVISPEEDLPEENRTGIPLDPVHIRILSALLQGQDAAAVLKEHHIMPSIAADSINEALWDEIGDTVLLCEGDALLLVEDYAEDLERLLGGTGNE